MSLSKESSKQAVSKSSRAVHVGGAVTKVKAFAETNLIVLTVNPELDKAASEEKLNAKAESAKQMFSDYRNKK